MVNITKNQLNIRTLDSVCDEEEIDEINNDTKYKDPNTFTNISNKMILSHIMDDNSSVIANKGSVDGDNEITGIDDGNLRLFESPDSKRSTSGKTISGLTKSPDYYDIKNKDSDGTNNLHQKINNSSLKVIKNAVGPIKQKKNMDVYIIPEQLNECQVPTLNTQQCYKSRNYECPIVNGSYLQCTNNYIPSPKHYNADCGNRTFDMVPYPWKISENCYYNKIGFDRNKKYDKVKYV
jgi:hypothetical protein